MATNMRLVSLLSKTLGRRSITARAGKWSLSASGHGGHVAAEVFRAHGIDTMFTLSGGHVFPLYDGAVRADEPIRLVDVRHEQTAVFAADGMARLTRNPGLAVLTAGPGVTNGISGIATAYFNGSPVLVLGGRAPAAKWGSGSLQELDHPALLGEVTKHAATISSPTAIARDLSDGLQRAGAPHRGPVFLDVAVDHLFTPTVGRMTAPGPLDPLAQDPDQVDAIGSRIAAAERPVVVLGTDVWMDGAEEVALAAVEELGVPAITNGMGRGVLPGGHPLLATRARGHAFGNADLVVVVGTPLDFRLGYGSFGDAEVCHVMDSTEGIATHATLAASAVGDLATCLVSIVEATQAAADWRSHDAWATELRQAHAAAVSSDAEALTSDADPIHPARIYGELNRRLDDDTVVIGDGGDFVSYAGRYIEPQQPGCWLDPGPYGCLGTGPGYAMAAGIARPSSPVVLLLGDGAAGFSLMDVDSLVRHDLPVVMIVGNNSAWGLEKHPMQQVYGYDVAADLAPETPYDQVVTALGGGGETVTSPAEIGPAIQRALDAGVPYLVNVITDPENTYPRNTLGM